MIGSVYRAVLRDHDLTVAMDGRQALELLRSGARFDVIFCDLMMPVMTGMELHAALVSELPEQAERMVFVSGGAFTPSAQAFLDEVPNQRLDKPFEVKNVQALVQSFVRR
jgi:CheY-like chemotaxis protein